MTKALKYLKKEGLEESVIKDDVDLTTWLEDLMQSYADEQVKKALEEVEKSLPSDEELLKSTWDRDITIEQVKEVKKYRNKTQEVINKLRQ